MNILVYIKKIFIFLLITGIIIFSLALPYNTKNIDKLAYVIALGLDKR